MKPKIVVVGSANTDMVVKVQHLPEPGETVLGGDYIQARGGKGANQAVTAARLGADVTFVGRVGQDLFGEDAVTHYKTEGINTEYIVKDPDAPSGVALIMVNQGGENVIAVAPGANAKLSPADIQAAEAAIKDAKCVLIQLEIPLDTVEAAIELASKHGVSVILNPAPAMPLPPQLLGKVDYLTPNQNEAATLAGGFATAHAKDAAHLLRSKYRSKNIIVTLGEDGALVTGFRSEVIPAFEVQPVDTTGAGDAFNGGLAVALARGDTLASAVKFANAVAALSTTRPGAQSSLPTLEEVEAFIQAHAGKPELT